MQRSTINLLFILIISFCSFDSQAQGLYEYYLSQIRNNYIQGKLETVEYYVEKGKGKYPDSTIFYLQSADLKYFLKDYEGVIKELNIAQGLGSTNPQLYFSRAVAYHNLKNLDSAALDYQKFLSNFPLDTFARVNYGILEFERKNYSIAKQQLSSYVNDDKFEFPRKQLILAEIYKVEKDFDSVIWISTKILDIDSTVINAYKLRALAHEELNHDFKFCEDYLKAFELGDYSVKQKFDTFGCFEILNMSDPNSPYSYPPPPPEIIVIEEEIIEEK